MSYYNGIYFQAITGKIVKKYDGTEILVPQDTETVECARCGEEFILSDCIENHCAFDSNNKIICEDCEGYGYEICDICGEWCDELQDVREGVEGGARVCQNCIENSSDISQCECCGNLVIQPYRTADGYYLCQRCWDDDTYSCNECNDVFYDEDNLRYDEDDEYYYCDRCYDEKPICNYSYKPYPRFLVTTADTNCVEYFGFEIEVCGRQSYAKGFLERLDNPDDVYLKRDGSVDGFEIVTHPMTRNYFYKEFMPDLKIGLEYLKSNGFRGHNRGGIHIHVSRKAIDEDMLAKMVMLLYPKEYKIKQKWLAITQRREYEMDRWSSMSGSSIDGKKETINYIKKVKKDPERIDFEVERYTAINTKNDSTYEFRIFNSNIRPERIIKNAEVIFSLIDFCKTDKLPTMGNYLRFVAKNKEQYKDFYEFLLEKKIIQSDEQKRQTEQVTKALSEIADKKITKNDISEYLQSLNLVPDFSTPDTDNENTITV